LSAQTTITTSEILTATGNDYTQSTHYFGWTLQIPGDGSAGLIIVNGSTTPGATGNTVAVNAATTTNGVNFSVAGGGSTTVAVTNNTVNVTDTVSYSVYGGISAWDSDSAAVTGNRVTLLTNAEVTKDATGGFAYRGLVQNNSVAVGSAARVLGGVFGGAVNPATVSGTANSLNNTVALSGASFVTGVVMAGSTTGGLNSRVSDNRVTMTDAGTIADSDVIGGYIYDGPSQTLSSNSVTVYAGTINGTTYGALGRQIINSSITGNSVTITGPMGNISTGSVYGAAVQTAVAATGNTLTGNAVTINGGTIDGRISGAQAWAPSTVTNNTVTIETSTYEVTLGTNRDVHGGHIYGDGTVSENTVTINAGNTMTGTTSNIYGGMLWSQTPGTGTRTAQSNVVNLVGRNFTVQDVYGGYAGEGITNTATGNTVNIVDTYSPEGSPYGIFKNVYGGAVTDGNATGNSVVINSAFLTDNVYGGYVQNAGNATGNTVTLSGSIGLINASFAAGLYGGSSGLGDAFTGNRLIINQIQTTVDGKFANISNFENYDFIIDGNLITDSYAVLRTVAMNLQSVDPVNNPFDVTRLDILGGEVLQRGSQIVLVQSDNAILLDSGSNSANLDTVTVHHSIYLNYDAQIALVGDSRQLVANITAVRFNEQANALAEMGIASLGMLNRGSDMIADEAIPASMASSLGLQGYTVFGTVRVGKERFQSGSHVDLMGVTGQVGVAWGTETNSGYGTLGAFVEFGKGEYDSYNTFDQFPLIHGNGTVTYFGGGLLGRYDMGQSGRSHPYFEASAHMGTSKIDFGSPDFGVIYINNNDKIVETSGRYFGYHAGMGYFLEFADYGNPSSLDISAKYFYTEREDMSADVLGVKADFAKVQSSRIRAGGRYTYGMTDLIKPFVGGYYEREFQGGSAVKLGDTVIPEASINGSTGIGELGVTLTSSTLPIDLEVGVKGYGGERDGVVGGLKFNYSF
jgi:hypothetical protein